MQKEMVVRRKTSSQQYLNSEYSGKHLDRIIGRNYHINMSVGRGSAGNVIAALASFFIPGLRQLLQGELVAFVLFLIGAGFVWLISFGTLGWIMHL
jgi:hypothetical protein